MKTRIAGRLGALALMCTAWSMATADLFGPSLDTTLLTGHGYDPLEPTVAKDSPFADLTTIREANSFPVVSYKFEISTTSTSSFVERTFGAELEGRVGLYKASASLNVSQQKQHYRNSVVVNFYKRLDFGSERVNTNNSNLRLEAIALQNNPAGWLAKYGSQVVTRRSRGGLVIGKLTFDTTNTKKVNGWLARFSAEAGGSSWGGSVSSTMSSLMTEATSQLNAKISISGYGGRGMEDLAMLPGEDPLVFSTYLAMMQRYSSNMTFDNAAITQYQTADYTQYVNRGTTPFIPSVAETYLRYLDLKAKEEVLDDIVANASVDYPWLNPDQVASLATTRDAINVRKAAVWAFGTKLVRSPKSVQGLSLPADIAVTIPRIRPQITTAYLNPGAPTGWVVTVTIPNAYRLRGHVYGPPPAYPSWSQMVVDPSYTSGTRLIASRVSSDPSHTQLRIALFDERAEIVGSEDIELLP